MDEKIKKAHSLDLDNRQMLKITGVTDVDSFDEETINAYTDYGLLTISGENLHIEELNLDSGDLNLKGNVVALVYSEKTKKSSNIFKRLFSD